MLNTLSWIFTLLLALAQPQASSPSLANAASEVLGTQAPPSAIELRGKTYVALGDSISVGSYAPSSGDIFPARVAQELDMHLVLVARSGAKAGWALPQLHAVESAHPALVSIELGTNDVGFKTPLSTFEGEYDTIVRQVSSIPGVRVVCVGSWLPSSTVDQAISDTCRRYGGNYVSLQGYYFVDAFHARAGSPTFRGKADWFHPGEQGHAAIAAAILAEITEAAQSSPTRVRPMNVW